MSRARARGEEIRRYILQNVQANASNISRLAIDHFGISRQAVNQHLSKLVSQGDLTVTGRTRARSYALAPVVQWSKTYPIEEEPAEDVVWRDDVAPILHNLPDNVLDIWAHGFTEMFNNARDHSEGAIIYVSVMMSAVTTEMTIMDDGVGIFRKIQAALHLLDERHALFELSKGKLTADPARHSGERIFFTSRMFDGFDILSGGVFFYHEHGKEEDWLSEREHPRSGTSVFMKLGNHTARTTKEVFDQYSSDADDYGFTKTVVPVRLAQYGNDKLISRSQAKRVMARVELFRTVLLDFENVPSIGQAFADEVFRVFPLSHPDVQLFPINANSEVKRMITRSVQAGGRPPIVDLPDQN